MTLETINDGVIYVDGEPLTHMPAGGGLVVANEKYLRQRRSKIGMVFQQFNLFPHMSALKNCIEAPIQVLGLSRDEAEERALDLLKMVGDGRKEGSAPDPTFRRSATACGNRTGIGDASQGHCCWMK